MGLGVLSSGTFIWEDGDVRDVQCFVVLFFIFLSVSASDWSSTLCVVRVFVHGCSAVVEMVTYVADTMRIPARSPRWLSQNRNALNVTDGRIFWWSLYLTPVVWVLLGVVCVLKFNLSYLLLVVVALVLSCANIYGYYHCNKDATEQMRSYVQQTVLGAAMDRFLP